MASGLIALAATFAPLVTNGAADQGDPAIVAIVDSTGQTACSGTVIDPHVVLTAAHCIVPQIERGASVVVGSSVSAPVASLPIAAFRVHPAYDPTTFANDAAVLVLGSSAPVAPEQMGTVAPRVGSTVGVVGWGESGATTGDYGTKRAGTAMVTAVDPLAFEVGPNPSQPCTGDSGGPAIGSQDGTSVVVGITSHGDPACTSTATYTRVDAVAGDFVSPMLARLGAGTAGTGERCLYPEQCAAGASSCVAAADQPSLAYCTGACSVAADCPTGMLCVEQDLGGSQCRYPVPTPGAFGGHCAVDTDCYEGVCTGALCTVACNPGAADSCPSDATCQESGSGIAFYCVPTATEAAAGSSCRVSPAPRDGVGGPIALTVLAGAGFAVRLRRTARSRRR